jgi:hypothetical protein
MPILRSNPSLPVPMSKVGLKLWASAFDPANNGTQPANGSAISSLIGKGVSGIALNQGTGANQPSFVSSAQNGKPAVRFDGTNDFVQSNAASLAVTSSFSIYAICKLSSASNTNQAILSKGNSSGDPDYLMMLNNGGVDNKLAFYNGSAFVTSVNTISNTAAFNIYTLTWNNVSPGMYINGVVSGVSGIMVSPSTVGGNFVLGGQGASGTVNFFNGDMLDVLVYNLAHSASDVADIVNFFANFYGLNL